MYIQNGILNILESTVLAFCNQLAKAANAQLGTNISVVLFDTAPEEEELPKTDVIGSYNLEFKLDSHFIDGTFLLGVATLNDPSLFRLRQITSFVLDEVMPEKTIQLYNAEGVPILGNLIIMEDVTVLPTNKDSKSRAARFIGVPFKCTRTT